MNFVYGALSMRLQACYHTIRAKYRAANKTRLEGRGGGGAEKFFPFYCQYPPIQMTLLAAFISEMAERLNGDQPS